jgi:hypothetical protein
MPNLPNTEEWRHFESTHELTEKADVVASMVTHLLSFAVGLRRARRLVRDAALFVVKKGWRRYMKD